MVAAKADAVMKPTPGIVVCPAAGFAPSVPFAYLGFKDLDLSGQGIDLIDQRYDDVAHKRRNVEPDRVVCEHPLDEFRRPLDPNRRYDAYLGAA